MSDEKPAVPEDNEFTQWHEVAHGESLSKIAEKYYGDASLWKQIYEANTDKIKNPNLIQVGWKLRIP